MEKTLNTFLDNYNKIYYTGATSSAFIEERGENYIFYIGILKQNQHEDDKIAYKFTYKTFSTI